MRFFSDNAAAACPAVMAALADANQLSTAYDGDPWSARLDAAFSALFETEVEALWVATGTAANSLALAALCPPHGSILCHRDAHIQNDECGAPEFYTHGAKLLLADGPGAKLDVASVEALLATVRDDVHQTQPAALSITNATEYGLVYTPGEVAALGPAVPRARTGLSHGRRALRQRGRAARLLARRSDLARGRRRFELRLRQEWRHVGRGPDLLRRRPSARDPLPPQARRPSAVEGPLPRRADPGDARRRYLARQCARGERRRGPARGGSGRPAGPSGRGQRGLPQGQRRRGGGACAARVSIFTIGVRARPGWW